MITTLCSSFLMFLSDHIYLSIIITVLYCSQQGFHCRPWLPICSLLLLLSSLLFLPSSALKVVNIQAIPFSFYFKIQILTWRWQWNEWCSWARPAWRTRTAMPDSTAAPATPVATAGQDAPLSGLSSPLPRYHLFFLFLFFTHFCVRRRWKLSSEF